MTSFDELLKENYDVLTSDECRTQVTQFIRETPSVLGYDINLIKKLTKIAQHILNSDSNSLDEFLERLFQFNNEGIQIIEEGLEGYTQNRLLNLKSHFFAYKGDAAKASFEKTQGVTWAEEWYEAYKTSADISITAEPRHAAYAYARAGDAAKALFGKTKNLSWAKKWYNTKKLSADMAADIEPQFAAHTSYLAGDAARIMCKELPRRTEKIKWAKRAIQYYNNFLDYYKLYPSPQIGKLVDQVNSDILFLGRFLYKK